MLNKSYDANEIHPVKPTVSDAVLTSDRFDFLDQLPLIPVFTESLPDGLIEDEI